MVQPQTIEIETMVMAPLLTPGNLVKHNISLFKRNSTAKLTKIRNPKIYKDKSAAEVPLWASIFDASNIQFNTAAARFELSSIL